MAGGTRQQRVFEEMAALLDGNEDLTVHMAKVLAESTQDFLYGSGEPGDKPPTGIANWSVQRVGDQVAVGKSGIVFWRPETMPTMKVYDDTKGAGTCKSCAAPITWYELTSGKRHPFDGEPTYVRTSHDENRRLVGEIDTTVDKSHFATCPDAGKWRKK